MIRDSKTKDLLLAMMTLVKKVGNEIWFVKNKTLLDKHLTVFTEDTDVDWDTVQIHQAYQSGQAIKTAIKQWGDCKWQSRWNHLDTCRQTKVWLPHLKGELSPQI